MKVKTIPLPPSGGGSGDMTKAVYDPNDDGIIALAQLDTAVSTFDQTDHDSLPNPHHSNNNDPTSSEKAALVGTNGTPSGTNKYVTNSDSRNTDARTPVSHNNTYHSEAYITQSAITTHEGASDPHTGYQKESEKGSANGYAGLDSNSKVPTTNLGGSGASGSNFLRGDQTWAAPGGGSDPWTHVILGSNFSTTLTTNEIVTGLSFTPSANKRYYVKIVLLTRTAAATTGPRPGIAWPSGLNDGGSRLFAPTSNTAMVQQWRGALSTANAASTGLPDTTNSYLMEGEAYFITGATPSGNFQITLASETSGTSVTIRAGSFISYREIA